MAYEGELLSECPQGLDFSFTQAVVVSGASWNPCGHMILCVGNSSDTSWYFHVAGAGVREVYGVYAYPKFMREEGYQRYLLENSKRELRRLDAMISNPDGMASRSRRGPLMRRCAPSSSVTSPVTATCEETSTTR